MLSQTLVANLSLTSSVLGPSNLRIKKFWMAWSGERERAEILPRGADPLSANTALAATSSFYSSLLPLQLHLCYLYSAILQLYFSSLLRPLPLAPSSLSPSLDGSLSPALFPRSSFSFAMLSLSTDIHTHDYFSMQTIITDYILSSSYFFMNTSSGLSTASVYFCMKILL